VDLDECNTDWVCDVFLSTHVHHFELYGSVRDFLEIRLRHWDLELVSYRIGPVWIATLLNDTCLYTFPNAVIWASNADESVWGFEPTLWVLKSNGRLDFYI
jgi:hypothetical protein